MPDYPAYEIDCQLTLLDMTPQDDPPRKQPRQKPSPKPVEELIYAPYQYMDITPGHGDLLGDPYWEIRAPWREDGIMLNTGVAPRKPIQSSLSSILEAHPDRKYYLTTVACLGILRRADQRDKELPTPLELALMAQAGLIPAPDGTTGLKAYHINQRDEGIDLGEVSGALMATANMQMQTFVTGDPIAFAANQRDEVRDLHDLAGALGAQPGMKQQTFISEGCLTPWDTQQKRIFLPNGTAPTLTGADGGGGRNPAGLLFSAAFSAGQGAKAGGIGYQEECAPTLKAAESGSNMVPSVLCLNDQGGSVMECTVDKTGTLRAQEHGHQPLVFDNHGQDSRFTGPVARSQTVSASFGAGGNNQPLVLASQQGHADIGVGVCPAITAAAGMSGNNQPVLFENHGIDARYTGPHKVAPTLSARAGTGGNNLPLVAAQEESGETPIICITGNAIDRQPQNGGNGLGIQEDIAYTLTATDHHAVFTRQRVDVFKEGDVVSTESARQHKDATDLIYQETVGALTSSDRKGPNAQYVNQDKLVVDGPLLIRRLTPLECERLQGFPDLWTALPGAADSARYKALGNSVAVPCVVFIMRGLAAVLRAAA